MNVIHTLDGRRILIVEDEGMLAVEIEELLIRMGCIVIGPSNSISRAACLAQEENIDAAILDVNIRGQKIYPVAEILQSCGIPFIFLTGYGNWSLPAGMRDTKILSKPFSVAELKACLLDFF